MESVLGNNPIERRKQSRILDAEVGSRIRAHRKIARMTLQGLADRLGIAYQQVQKYETGVNRIGAGRLMEIAGILEIPVANFFANENALPDEILTSAEVTPVVGIDPEATLQGRQLLVAFLCIKDLDKRKSALAFVRTLADPEIL